MDGDSSAASFLDQTRRQWAWYRQKLLVKRATERQLLLLEAVLAQRDYFEINQCGAKLDQKNREFNDLFIPLEEALKTYVAGYEIVRWTQGVDLLLEKLFQIAFIPTSNQVLRSRYYQVIPAKYRIVEELFTILRALNDYPVPEPYRQKILV